MSGAVGTVIHRERKTLPSKQRRMDSLFRLSKSFKKSWCF